MFFIFKDETPSDEEPMSFMKIQFSPGEGSSNVSRFIRRTIPPLATAELSDSEWVNIRFLM